MKTKVVYSILCLFFAFSSSAQIFDVEPNNTCLQPQDAGLQGVPIVFEGNLETSADVDFYRFVLKPDERIRINMNGVTLSDPYLGLFDSNCQVVAINDDNNGLNSQIEAFVPADGVIILGATRCCDGGFDGGGSSGTYTLTVNEIPPPARRIRGRLLNSVTGEPLSGEQFPFAVARLYRCTNNSCFSFTSSQAVSDDGVFEFESGDNLVIEPGIYQVEGRANDYEVTRSELFEIRPNEELNIGAISLLPPEISFSEMVGCSNIPPEGGLCLYHVRITNNRLDRVDGRVWSIVSVNSTGSPHGSSAFQAEPVLNEFSLMPLEDRFITFEFTVDAEVADFASFCPAIYISGSPENYTNTLEGATPFCASRVDGQWKIESLKEVRAREGGPRISPKDFHHPQFPLTRETKRKPK